MVNYNKHNWDSIQEKINELNALEIKTNHNRLILHFTYQNIVIAVYPMRDEDENITKIILYLYYLRASASEKLLLFPLPT